MYNSFSRFPIVAYNILVYLAKQDTAENIWKMLQYSDYDCLSKPNLTFSEKMNLIWKTGPQEKFSVFLTPLVEDAITESKSTLKIYEYYIHDNDFYQSSVVYAFDFLYGGNMSLIDFDGIPASRAAVFMNSLMATLNGAEVGGVGKLSFVSDLTRYNLAKATIGNSKTFTGIQIFLSTKLGDSGVQSSCEN